MPNILRGPCAEACPPEVPPRVGPSVFTLALAPARARHKDGHKKRILAHPHIYIYISADPPGVERAGAKTDQSVTKSVNQCICESVNQ